MKKLYHIDFAPPSMNVAINGTIVRYTGDDDETFGDMTAMLPRGPRCMGAMAVYYGPVVNPLSNFSKIRPLLANLDSNSQKE